MTVGVSDASLLQAPVPPSGAPKGHAKGRGAQGPAFEALLDSAEPPADRLRGPSPSNKGRRPDHAARPQEDMPPARGSETGRLARAKNADAARDPSDPLPPRAPSDPSSQDVSDDDALCRCPTDDEDEAAVAPAASAEDELLAALASAAGAPDGEAVEEGDDETQVDGEAKTDLLNADVAAAEPQAAASVNPPAAVTQTDPLPLDTMPDDANAELIPGAALPSQPKGQSALHARAKDGSAAAAAPHVLTADAPKLSAETAPAIAPHALSHDGQSSNQPALPSEKEAAPEQRPKAPDAAPIASAIGKRDMAAAKEPLSASVLAPDAKAAASPAADAQPGPHAAAEPQKADAPATAQNNAQPAPANQPQAAPPPGLLTAVPHAPIAIPALIAAHAANAARQDAPVPLAGVPIEIAARAVDGQHRFEIRLDPPELGRIDVRLDVDKNGAVTSRLIVERAETLDLLRRDAPALEKALQSAGLKTNEGALEFSLRDQSFAQRDQDPQRNERAETVRAILQDDDLPPVDAARRGYGRLIGLGNGLDISV